MRRIATWVLISAAVIATAATALAASPKAFRAKVIAATLAQTSVRRTSTHTESLPGRYSEDTVTADVSVASGSELDRFQSTDQHGRARILLVGGTVYFRGDAVALEQYFDLTEAKAKHYAGRWISIPKGDKLYSGFADSLTLASVVRFIPRGHLRLSRRWMHGRRFIVLYGSSPSVDLYVHARGKPLPVGFSDGGLSAQAYGRFSKWNESVTVQAPASSTPIATVRGG